MPAERASRTTADAEMETPRHACHCGKSFIRKEHLRRHQATHGDGGAFTCTICDKSFTRNDLLRRHVTVHDKGSELRREKACNACHANKTRCDGGEQCSLCKKRKQTCVYGEDNKPKTVPLMPLPGGKAGLPNLIQLVRKEDTSMLQDYEVSREDAWIKDATDRYLGRFHQSWPVVHGPTVYNDPPPLGVMATIIMIGLWLKGDEDMCKTAEELHNLLMDKLLIELNESTSNETETPWPTELYQAATLNVVFAFCRGNTNAVAKALLLRGILVAVLREANFFELVSAQEQQRVHYPGRYVPYVMSTRDRWAKIISALLKIDTYLSILRQQSPAMPWQELNTNISGTFALWNADGLQVFFKRLEREPVDRIDHMFTELRGPIPCNLKHILVLEDVQLGLCIQFQDIWSQTMQPGLEADEQTLQSADQMLEYWKDRALAISGNCKAVIAQEEPAYFPFSAYLGRYDEEPERERAAAAALVDILAADSMMLYHLVKVLANANIRTMRAMAVCDKSNANNTPACARGLEVIRSWCALAQCRIALAHALTILRTAEAMPTRELDADPITELALSLSAFVVWAWLTYRESPCSCIIDMNTTDIAAVNLEGPTETAAENWKHSRGTISMAGQPLCRCLLPDWMKRFKSALSQRKQSWDIGQSLTSVL